MKKMKWIGIMGCVAAALLGGCSKSKPVLHVYNWADYIKPELVEQFEAQEQCRVVIDTFDSNESMYAKLKAGATGYDVIFPSSYMAKIMNDQDMLLPINPAALPNLKNLDPAYLDLAMDRAMAYSVPYMLSITGIGYLTDRLPDFEASWTMFNDPAVKGACTLLNDMRETIGAGLKARGYSLNSTSEAELAEARDQVIEWKRNIAKFENEQYKNGLASEEFILVHGYSGDILQVQEENENIDFAIPREGTSITFDDMVIPRDARNVALAHKFINYLHDPEVAAENTEYISYLCPNKASYAYLSEETRENPILFPPEEVVANLEVVADLGEENAKYTKVWDQIKAAE
ncbi:MAG: spermidine/putrescine ABC transporter substrate-binding protein [Spartobacteria bacterium]|nr:spermidine/putrescine ABC transporter substrate-binding protein [Spartobacteria bacterium]